MPKSKWLHIVCINQEQVSSQIKQELRQHTGNSGTDNPPNWHKKII